MNTSRSLSNTRVASLYRRVGEDVLAWLSMGLLLILAAWMAVGLIGLGMDLYQSLGTDWARATEHMIAKALLILAIMEVIRTLQSYSRLGRVRVTFILDTALVVLIGELMGLWFRNYTPEKVLTGMGVIVTLVLLRIVTARHSPDTATL